MKAAGILFLLLTLTTSPAYALNCLTPKAMIHVMTFNGFFEFAGGGNPMGQTVIFVNPVTGAYKIWIVDEKNACEVLGGKEFYIMLDKEL